MGTWTPPSPTPPTGGASARSPTMSPATSCPLGVGGHVAWTRFCAVGIGEVGSMPPPPTGGGAYRASSGWEESPGWGRIRVLFFFRGRPPRHSPRFPPQPLHD